MRWCLVKSIFKKNIFARFSDPFYLHKQNSKTKNKKYKINKINKIKNQMKDLDFKIQAL